MKTVPDEAGRHATTRLGDWYATLVFVERRPLVLAVSDRTLLPVVVASGPGSTLVARLVAVIAEVLLALGVERMAIEQELHEMAFVAIGRTSSRQITGTLVDFAKSLEFYLARDPSLLSCSLKLAKTPCSVLDMASPDGATLSLFSAPSNDVLG